MPKKKAVRKRARTIPDPSKTTPAHPWRLCPAGQHYRSATTVRPHTRNGHPVQGGPRSATCAHNSSGRDQLYPEEMQEIALRNFDQFKSEGLGTIKEFNRSPYPQNAYDHLIRGWVQYWNEVLKPREPLDPKLVKALIATESGFDPSSSNKRRGPSRARGLMQVTDGSIQYMKDDYLEFVDHYLNLTEDDMLDPNLAVCAGIRWLYRKKQLASVKLGRDATWIEAVAEYKAYLNEFEKSPNHIQMRRFLSFYEELKNAS